MELMQRLMEKARENKKNIVLPEGEEERVIIASSQITTEGLANVVILGDEDRIRSKASDLKVNLDGVTIENPLTSNNRDKYANELYELRKNKGLTIDDAYKLILDNNYYGTMMLKMGDVDGLVSGSINTTAATLRPGLQIIKMAPGISIVSSFFIMLLPDKNFGDDGVMIFADCAINPNPTADELASIAISTAKTAADLCDIEPRIAMLSFSTKGSAKHEFVDKVVEAFNIVKEREPNINIDGELQLDAAIMPEVAARKAPGSKVAGYANVLVFPDLEAGNIGCKLVERFGKAQAVGPVCQGFAKPINDLSRGCSADDIVKTVVITVIQAQNNK